MTPNKKSIAVRKVEKLLNEAWDILDTIPSDNTKASEVCLDRTTDHITTALANIRRAHVHIMNRDA